MLKKVASEARGARASHFERSRAWFKRAMKREARARACFEARIVALAFISFSEVFKKYVMDFRNFYQEYNLDSVT